MRAKQRILLAGLFFATSPIFASTITVSLRQSTQSITATGLGPNAMNDGQWQIQLGTCFSPGGNTTCEFTGFYVSNSPGFTSGTYLFETDYLGQGPSPLFAQSTQPFGNQFFFTNIAPGTLMFLTLGNGTGASQTIPIFKNGVFLAQYNVAFVNSNCSGTPISPCSFAGSGQTPGSIFSSVVTGSATFDSSDVTTIPEPSSLVLAGSGMLALAGMARRRFVRR